MAAPSMVVLQETLTAVVNEAVKAALDPHVKTLEYLDGMQYLIKLTSAQDRNSRKGLLDNLVAVYNKDGIASPNTPVTFYDVLCLPLGAAKAHLTHHGLVATGDVHEIRQQLYKHLGGT